MSDRPTPETDAVRFYLKTRTTYDLTDFEIWKNHAEKLEQERDGAREDATNYYARVGELENERDEAREEINRYREKLDLLPISWDV